MPSELRVLIVDDDEDDVLLTGDLLRALQGWRCRVTWAEGAEEAAREIGTGGHDVYLVDYRLGGRSGLDVLEGLRASGSRAPAILLTGFDDHAVDLAAMRLGAADYLVKGELSAAVLERSLRYALERARLLREVELARQEAETLFTLSTILEQSGLQPSGLEPSELEQSGRAEEVMEGALALLAGAVGIDAALLWEARGEHAHLLHLHGEARVALREGPGVGTRVELPRAPAPLRRALAGRQPVYLGEEEAGADLRGAMAQEAQGLHPQAAVRSLAHLPLAVGGRVYVLSYLRLSRGRWTDHERRLLEAGGRSIGVALERRHSIELLAAAALTDGLTGLGNRRAFEEALDAALNSASRHSYAVSVVSFDLDGLKEINDTQGHARGDGFLRAFAQVMRAGLRREDRLYPFGGDEFAAILSHTGPSGFEAVLRRVRSAVDGLRAAGFPQGDVSAGIAAFPAEAQTAGELMRLSDARMYGEKLRHRAERGREA